MFVAGDALLDVTKTKNLEEKSVGGGAVNTARVLGNLEIPTWFIGCLSDDENGKLIENSLKQSGVHLDYAHRSKLPTATATLGIDKDGNASYEFDFKAKATFEFGDWLPEVKPKVLHVGSLSSVLEPGASALFSWASTLKCEIIYDPNVRPMIFYEKEGYRKSFIKWASISKIVKLSEDDLKWLGFEVDSILEFGAEFVVLTLGENGIRAYSRSFEVEVAAVPVDVVDTVGAGDTVGAVIAETMYLGIPLSEENLKISLEKAAIAASITCGKMGAVPVTRNEIH